jgi:dTDP-4-amino-4,6-dideoxygalactose transaminase
VNLDAELDALRRVLESGRLGSEDETVALEEELATHTGHRVAVTTSSGSAAIELALRALDIGPGDDVVVPAFTCRAVADAVRATGARPVFADVVWPSGTVDAASVERAVTPRTRAVIGVDTYGAPAPVHDLEALSDALGLALLVDQAQSFGARPPAGHLVVTSFHPSKVLAAGEGGAVLTDRVDLADRVRYLRSPGALQVRLGRPVGATPGRSLRMSDLDAALARCRLPLLDQVVTARRVEARRWIDALAHAGAPVSLPDDDGHAYSCLPVLLHDRADRAAVLRALESQGLGVGPGYPALHGAWTIEDPCPLASDLAARSICLPTHPGVGGRPVAGEADLLAGSAALSTRTAR